MVFSIIIIVMIGIVAFFHYVQGFFSATISAMIAVIAAVMAVSYDETVVGLLLKGKAADVAHAMMLCAIFAVIYVVLRIIFDAAIPGNVRTPATVDKVGAAVMGIVAGICVTGIFAIAAEMLPFDPAMGFLGYSRFNLTDRSFIMPVPNAQSLDVKTSNEMQDNTLDPAKEKGLLIPVDDWVLDAVYHLSAGGSLAGSRTLASIHPDYLTELFGERAGIQTGGRRSALHFVDHPGVEVSGVYSVPTLQAIDGQIKEIRPPGYVPSYGSTVKAGPDQRILVVRVKVKFNVTDDDDQIFRFSTGSVRLVGNEKDFYPIGTLEKGQLVLLNKPDDYLFIKTDRYFDAVFVVDQSLLVGGKSQNSVASGVFIGVKRFANIDLSGMAVAEYIPPDPNVFVLRSNNMLEKLKTIPLVPLPVPAVRTAATPSAAAASQTPAADVQPSAVSPSPAPAAEPGKDISTSLTAVPNTGIMAPGSIALGTTSTDANAQGAPVAGGTVSVKSGQISAASVDPTASLSDLGQGASTYSQFYVPQERTMIQVVVHPYTANWDWLGQLGSTSLIDTNGNKYPPSGMYALAKTSDSRGLLLRYDANHGTSVVTPGGSPEGDIYYIFLIPHDTDVKSLAVGSAQQNLDATVHVQ